MIGKLKAHEVVPITSVYSVNNIKSGNNSSSTRYTRDAKLLPDNFHSMRFLYKKKINTESLFFFHPLWQYVKKYDYQININAHVRLFECGGPWLKRFRVILTEYVSTCESWTEFTYEITVRRHVTEIQNYRFNGSKLVTIFKLHCCQHVT